MKINNISEHVNTLQQLVSNKHPGNFHGIEKRLMIAIILLKFLFPSFWIRERAWSKNNIIRNIAIDTYIISKVIFMLATLTFWRRHYLLVQFATIYLFADLVIYLLWIVILLELNKSHPNFRRNLIMLGINMLEIISAFAIFYLMTNSLHYTNNQSIVSWWIDAFYFSTSTLATVWYGDIVAMGKLWHLISTVQILIWFFFVSLVFTGITSKLTIKQD